MALGLLLLLGSPGLTNAQFLPRVHIVEGSEIRLGMCGATKGRVGFLGAAAKLGCEASFFRVNQEGGISGRKVVLIDYDDQNEPIEAVSNTEKLIEHDKVFGLLNYLGTSTARAVLPMVSESNIVFLGPLSGAEVFRQPVQPLVFNTRPSYSEETELLVTHLIADLAVKKVALFRQDDSYGDAGRAS